MSQCLTQLTRQSINSWQREFAYDRLSYTSKPIHLAREQSRSFRGQVPPLRRGKLPCTIILQKLWSQWQQCYWVGRQRFSMDLDDSEFFAKIALCEWWDCRDLQALWCGLCGNASWYQDRVSPSDLRSKQTSDWYANEISNWKILIQWSRGT